MKKILTIFLSVFLFGMLTITSFASEMHIYDEVGLMSMEELTELEAKASAVSEKHGCGVYMIVVKDYQNYSVGDVYDAAVELYHDLNLGKGEDREGMLLLLSMYDRDYATFFYGEHVEYAFNEYGQIQMEEYFLDDFRYDDWYDGFDDYITVCDEYLGLAAAGDPVRESHGYLFAIVVVGSVVIAFVAVLLLRASMKSVHRGNVASAYVTAEGLKLTQRSDRFLYNTQTRRRIQSSSKSGGGARSGGGGSGRKGKF